MRDERLAEQPTAPVKGRVRRANFMSGSGCLVQLMGIILGALAFFLIPFLGIIIGPLIFIGLMIVGGRMAMQYECSNCRNPVASKRVRLCPTCHAELR